jgi:hypothetical protein
VEVVLEVEVVANWIQVEEASALSFTRYWVKRDPPVEVGADQESATWALPGTATNA